MSCDDSEPFSGNSVTTRRQIASDLVERPFDSAPALIQHVRVYLCRLYARMTQQLLHGAYVVPGLEQVRCEGVAEGVAANSLLDARRLGGLFPGRLQHVFGGVVAAHFARARVARELRGREDPLPYPFGRRILILPLQR